MEPIYSIRTEIPEDILSKILICTYPRKRMVFVGVLSFVEIVLGMFILCSGIKLEVRYQYQYSVSIILAGILILAVGGRMLVKTARAPRVQTNKWISNLRIQTGRSDWVLNLEFLEEEFQAVNPYAENEKEKLHIPYDYIQQIYDMDDVVILAAKTGRTAIRKQDVPGEEFLPWLLSKCNRVSVKTLSSER